ncbi:hypothetical protein bpr_I2188 [Butyrivibrio proteoclasticus B316]|uniref:Uncharacterized protein n=2 Tax=Butyrivibrio proteoclasticus TaxID=43305 RepID=E0RX13_BUTPB|nr:hypothetical protein bpr_I2188 [Butyrivibrio proteoclasticus B316]
MGYQQMISYNCFISVVSDGNYIYWVSEITGIGMRMSIESNVVEYLNIPWKSVGIKPSGNAVLAIDGKELFGIAGNGKYFFSFNIEKCSIKLTSLSLENVFAHDFAFSGINGDYVYFLPYQFDQIVLMNKYSGEIEYISLETDSAISEDGLFCAGRNDTKSDVVTCFDYSSNKLFKISFTNRECLTSHYPSDIQKPLYVYECTDGYYILTISGDVFYWEEKNSNVRQVYNNLSSERDNTIPFASICVKNNKLWIMPCYSEDIVLVDLNNGSTKKCIDYPCDFHYKKNNRMSNYTRAVEINGTTYFAMHTGNYIFGVNENGNGEFINVIWPDDTMLIDQWLLSNDIVNEGEMKLSGFINYVNRV